MLLLGVLFHMTLWPLKAPQPCSSARTTLDTEQCLKRELSADSAKLTTFEARVRKDLSPTTASAFDSAASLWRSYRDQECRGVYMANSGGSIAGSALLGCKIELTTARLAYLRKVYTTAK
jgi:uncharacterized protein YecT (DUF1311 family)